MRKKQGSCVTRFFIMFAVLFCALAVAAIASNPESVHTNTVSPRQFEATLFFLTITVSPCQFETLFFFYPLNNTCSLMAAALRAQAQDFEAKTISWEDRWDKLKVASKLIGIKRGGVIHEVKAEFVKLKRTKFNYVGGYPRFIRDKFDISVKDGEDFLSLYYTFLRAGGIITGDMVQLPQGWENLSQEEMIEKLTDLLRVTTSFDDYLANNPTALAKYDEENRQRLAAYVRLGKQPSEEAGDGGAAANGDDAAAVGGAAAGVGEAMNDEEHPIIKEIKVKQKEMPSRPAVFAEIAALFDKFFQEDPKPTVDNIKQLSDLYEKIPLAGATLIHKLVAPSVSMELTTRYKELFGIEHLLILEKLFSKQDLVSDLVSDFHLDDSMDVDLPNDVIDPDSVLSVPEGQKKKGEFLASRNPGCWGYFGGQWYGSDGRRWKEVSHPSTIEDLRRIMDEREMNHSVPVFPNEPGASLLDMSHEGSVSVEARDQGYYRTATLRALKEKYPAKDEQVGAIALVAGRRKYEIFVKNYEQVWEKVDQWSIDEE